MPSNDYQRFVSQEEGKQKMKRIILETLIFVVLIVSAIILSIFLKGYLPYKITNRIKLEPNSDGFISWLNPPITTTRTYYLFNITNSINIMTNPKSAKIQVKDTPPYVYNMKTNKINVQWLNNHQEISYGVERLFTRHPERFEASLINGTGAFIDFFQAIVRTKFGVKPTPAFYSLGTHNAFHTKNPIELLEGFTSDIFKSAQEKMIGPNKDKGGYIYRQNGSRLYNVSIQTDLMKKGQVNTFASELIPLTITSPSHYSFPIYDSLTYPPLLPDKTSLNIFNPDFCHPILLQYKRSLSMFGMNLHEYRVKFIDINNCTNSSDTTTCNEVDRIDISKCMSTELDENTIILSKAHFYGSSNETMEKMNIDGFVPSSDKHDSVVYFEPHTGTPLKAVFRMQINIEAIIDPMKISEDTSELEPTNKKSFKRLIPVFWIDQEIDIDTKVKHKLKLVLLLRDKGTYIVISSAIVLSIIIIVIIEVLARRAARNNGYTRGSYIRSGC